MATRVVAMFRSKQLCSDSCVVSCLPCVLPRRLNAATLALLRAVWEQLRAKHEVATTARGVLLARGVGAPHRTRPDCVVPMLVRSRAARCLARSALNPPRRQLCGGEFALKNAFVTMQLHPGATTKQIKAKFYELAKATHPYATQGSNRVTERTRCVTPH